MKPILEAAKEEKKDQPTNHFSSRSEESNVEMMKSVNVAIK
jgi:hypothetical protein